MNKEYSLLIKKLDFFIRKYYKNQLLKGILYSLIIYLTFYLAVVVSEYVGNFPVKVRTALFYTTVLLYAAVFVKYIAIPLLHFMRIGKQISYEQASAIISKYFVDVQDKLLNTLELAKQSQANQDSDLLTASIEQKAKQIKPLQFTKAIDLYANLKYLWVLFACIAVFFIVYFTSPNIIKDSSTRLINFQTYYEPAAPFRFVLLTDTLSVQRGGDIKIKVRIEGEYVPDDVSIAYGGNVFIMRPETDSKSEFYYQFKNINNKLDLHFTAETFSSNSYTIKVLPAPVIVNFKLSVEAPAYTGENNNVYDNVGDVTVPYGSKLKWNFETKDIDSLYFVFNDSTKLVAEHDEKGYLLAKTLKQNSTYSISILNSYFKKKDVVNYTITVVPDLFPNITTISTVDSANMALLYFKGRISDDYGFKKLTFNYFYKSKPQEITKVPIDINKNLIEQEFYYMFDFNSISLKSGEAVDYYFEVFDNDGINGSKASRTNNFEYKVPTKEEIDDMAEKSSQTIENKIEESENLAEELQKVIEKLKKSNIDQSKSDWEKSNLIKEMVKKQKELEKLMDEITKENQKKNQLQNTFSEEQQEILEKQKKIEELLENIMTDEIRDLMKELEKLQEEFDEKKFDKIADDIQMSYEEMSKELDRNMEMLKKFEVEQKLSNIEERMKELAEEQKKLSEQSKDKKANDQELKKKQEELEKRFNEAMEDYKKAQKKNEELKNPMSLEQFEEDEKKIKDEMQDSKDNQEKGNNKKASKSQENAAQMMQQLSKKMQDMMDKIAEEENAENADDLRQILDNLIKYSFDQEELINDLTGTSTNDPKYVDIMKSQKTVNDNFVIINDSLAALALRTPELSSTINKEIISIRKNAASVLKLLEEKNTSSARSKQQFNMTSANNLALILSESLKQMNQQQSGSGSSGDKKQKQKGQQSGTSPIPQMKQAQQGLKKQLEQMIEQMKNGKGGKGKGMSQQLSKMLAEQEMMRQMLDELRKNGNLLKDTKKSLEEIDKLLKQNESDIVNRRIGNNTVDRQKKIMTRLLEAENAENEREKEKKREAKENTSDKVSKPKDIFKEENKKLIFKEDLNSTNLKLKQFYNKKYSNYLEKLNEE